MQDCFSSKNSSKLGIDNLLGKVFKTNDSALFRYHTDQKNLLQMIYI